MHPVIRIIKYLITMSLLAGGIVFFYPSETFVTFGQIAWYALLGVMCIRPLHDLFPKFELFSFLLKFRREIGIMAGVFGILHGMGSFIEQHNETSKAYLDLLAEPYTWNYQFCVFWGMLAALVSLPLILTSNGFSTSFLKQNWKRLQRLSYVMFLLVSIHIFVFKHEAGVFVWFGIWLTLFIVAWVVNKRKPKSTSAGPKRLCVPCGYIYDESVGDPDSGIAPGTRFEDLPDDWRCPVCGVGKGDFIFLLDGREITTATIMGIHELNPTVIELNISTQTPLSFRPGQFLSLGMEDEKGEFQRSYSIVEINGNLVKFLIKIKKEGRAGQWFQKAQVGDVLVYGLVSGNFTLSESVAQKVFIATGTGLSPIYAMIKAAPREIKKALYFSVSFKEDLFYFQELQAFTDIDLHIHITRESVPGLEFGRVNFEAFNYPLNTEFYICGNASVLSSAETALHNKGYTHIYFEKF